VGYAEAWLPRKERKKIMDFVFSAKFLIGMVIGAAVYHFLMARMNKAGG
jgi:hypothetical protein